MKIVFSEHALIRIRERKISKLEVYATIKNPQSKDETYRERILVRRNFGSKILEAVIRIEEKCIMVISAYYLDRKIYENKI